MTNTREVDDRYDDLVLKLMGESAYTRYVGSFHHAKIKDFIHQELQKARESEIKKQMIDVIGWAEAENAIGVRNLADLRLKAYHSNLPPSTNEDTLLDNLK